MLNANTVTHSQMFRFDVVFRNIGGPSSHFLLAPSFKPTDFKVSGDESQHSNIYLFIFLTLLIIPQFYRCTNQGNNYLIGHHRCTFWGHLMIGEAVTIAYNQSLLLKLTQTQHNICRITIYDDESSQKEFCSLIKYGFIQGTF